MFLPIVCATVLMPQADYRLVWSDEFSTPGTPDLAQWTPESGFVRNREAQWYRLENARVEEGNLVIEGRRERVENPNFSDASDADWKRSRRFAEFTSASLVTKQTWRFGRFEMRAKIDIRPGLWPAFWTVGRAREWPSGGEIDIMEYYRGNLLANAAWGTEKRWSAKWDSSSTPVAEIARRDGLESAEAWADKFHVWRMDWDEKEIRLYVDEHLLNTIDLTKTVNTSQDGANPFHEPHCIMVNLAIGGDNGGDPSTTEFPSRYLIDYVRVYQTA
ncbi:MAG TPA: glycoside hydrolase family 16 protein [Fimbriimonas sp.]